MKSIAIIGAGPSGLTAIKELKETKAFDKIVAFDRCSAVGGQWSMDPRFKRGVWSTLCMTEERRAMAYSDFPWEGEIEKNGTESCSFYPHHSETKAYLQAYAEHFGLLEHVRLNTEVMKIQMNGDKEATTWTITTKDKSGKVISETFDGLVVCAGNYSTPRHPLKDTLLKDFSGAVLHSQEFLDPTAYKGQRVLVVGSSVSGAEISNELATLGGCATLHNSVRHIPYHVTKIAKDGGTLSEKLFIRFPVWLGHYLPRSVTTKGLKASVLENFPNQITAEMGGPPDADVRVASIAPTVDYVDMVRQGKLAIRQGIAKARGREVTFTDGTRDEYDAIICCTGYNPNLSFLPKDIQNKILYTKPFHGGVDTKLYKHTLVPDIPSLAFCGYVQVIGSMHMMAEMQARYIAAIWSGKLNRPSEAKLEAGVKAFCDYREENAFNCFDVVPEACEDIADELGLTPTTMQALWNPSKLLFGPLLPTYYRTNPKIEGKEKAAKFQALFDYQIAHRNKYTTTA